MSTKAIGLSRNSPGKGALDVEAALNTGASIAEAVAALHKERLVHCNLNPVTIWINQREWARHDHGFRLFAAAFGGNRAGSAAWR